MEDSVVIVGSGPSGLAVAACLFLLSIPFIILEKEDCAAPMWKRRAYNRLTLHLAKPFCQLPHVPFPPSAPTFVPKDEFIRYLDGYAGRFKLRPVYRTRVESAAYDADAGKWSLIARDTETGEAKGYRGGFLVVATGENSEGYIPDLPGLEGFAGEVLHSSEYKSGEGYAGKRVLVVGCGNSGMEIAFDLASFGATTSICVRSPFHVVTKEIIYMGMVLLKYLPLHLVDALVVMFSHLKFGDLSKYGIVRPEKGPLLLKARTGRSPVIDVGTAEKIKSGDIQVVPTIESVKGNKVAFADGGSDFFDAILFATGFRSKVNNWLKDEGRLLDEEGLPGQSFPNHWKGKNGAYCVGLSRMGLAGISRDAQKTANDINKAIRGNGSLKDGTTIDNGC